MSRHEMPIRDYLGGEFNQSVNETGEDPFEAYIRLVRNLGARGLEYDTYAQATITSGGHALNPELKMFQGGSPNQQEQERIIAERIMKEAVVHNVDFAQKMAEELFRTRILLPKRTIEAATLGLIDGWHESDYMTFWLSTLAKPNFAGQGIAQQVDEFRKRLESELAKHDINLEALNHRGKSKSERAPYYRSIADAYVATLKGVEHEPVERLVAVSEIEHSLGGTTERYFAHMLGIAVLGLAKPETEPGSTSIDISSKNLSNTQLVEDVKKIHTFGGVIFNPNQVASVTIVSQ